MDDLNIFRLIKFIICLGLLGLVVTVGIYYYYDHINLNDINNETIGAFGDFIGGVIGTMFALTATLLIWLTYKTQKAELEQTSDTLRKQRFENTFFNLLHVQQEIRKNISFETSNRITWYQNDLNPIDSIINGDMFFEFAMNDFSRLYIKRPGLIIPAIQVRPQSIIQANLVPEIEVPMNQPLERIKQKYKQFFDNYHYQLSHYFRHLYNILKFIESTEKDEMELFPNSIEATKIKFLFYAGIIQAQMNSAELFIMFYNGLCFDNMENLIRKYNLLENLAKEDLTDTNEHQNLYGEGILKSRMDIVN